jgi:hypothetical protein
MTRAGASYNGPEASIEVVSATAVVGEGASWHPRFEKTKAN